MKLINKSNQLYDPIQELADWEKNFLGFSILPFANRGLSARKDNWFPAVDVSETENQLTVTADLPGLSKKDVSVTLQDNVLIIRGERKSETERKEKNFHRIERSYGIFERSVPLDVAIDPAKVQANYKDGVLEVTLPKVEQAKPKQIDVKVE